jgi:hypothetical protein
VPDEFVVPGLHTLGVSALHRQRWSRHGRGDRFRDCRSRSYGRRGRARWVLSHQLRSPWALAGFLLGSLSMVAMNSVVPVLVGRAFDAVTGDADDARRALTWRRFHPRVAGTSSTPRVTMGRRASSRPDGVNVIVIGLGPWTAHLSRVRLDVATRHVTDELENLPEPHIWRGIAACDHYSVWTAYNLAYISGVGQGA